MATFKTYFVDGKNLAKHSVLLELARTVGLPENEAEKVLTSRAYAKKVDKDWSDSKFKGITAVPTFIMGQQKLIGAQTYKALEDLITLYGVSKKTT